MESIDGLDEARVLGYFETIRSTFLLKMALLLSVIGEENGKRRLRTDRIDSEALGALAKQFHDPTFFIAVKRGNVELVENLHEDIAMGVVLGAWVVFEQSIKDLHTTNYAHLKTELSAGYKNNLFGFDKREKKDLDLFYYLRNAAMHSNGAFTAVTEIDHAYNGKHFKSAGLEGWKMEIDIDSGWRIARDLEMYALKAWSNTRSHRKASDERSA